MPINNTHDVPTVRSPQLQILNQGTPLVGAVSFEVNNNGYFQADTFTARFSLNADPSAGMDWWGNETATQYLLDIQASLDGGESWTSLLIGQVDHMSVHVDKGLIEVDGRDLSAYLIDEKTQETFQNKTSSQVIETLAARHGLIADVTPTPTLVGRYYQDDHERIGAGDFTRTTTEWTLACSLAQHENFDIWVTGTTLHFHPRTPIDETDPYVVFWDQENRISNAIDLTVQRSINFAKDVIVVVRSWNSLTSKSITKYAPSGARQAAIQSGKAAEYAFVFPNLTESEAQARANQIRAELSRHERLIEFVRPADLTLGARGVLQLQGTSSSWDTKYYVDSVVRSMSIERGFSMRVKAKNINPEFERVLPTA